MVVRWNNMVYTYHTYVSFVLIYLPARELLFVRWNNTVYTYHTYAIVVLIYLPTRELLFVRWNNTVYTYHTYAILVLIYLPTIELLVVRWNTMIYTAVYLHTFIMKGISTKQGMTYHLNTLNTQKRPRYKKLGIQVMAWCLHMHVAGLFPCLGCLKK